MTPEAWRVLYIFGAAFLTTGFALLGKLSWLVWQQHKALEESHITNLVQKIEELVDQINYLFVKHNGQEERIGELEKKHEAHIARCREREKAILKDFKTISKRQDDCLTWTSSERGE